MLHTKSKGVFDSTGIHIPRYIHIHIYVPHVITLLVAQIANVQTHTHTHVCMCIRQFIFIKKYILIQQTHSGYWYCHLVLHSCVISVSERQPSTSTCTGTRTSTFYCTCGFYLLFLKCYLLIKSRQSLPGPITENRFFND